MKCIYKQFYRLFLKNVTHKNELYSFYTVPSLVKLWLDCLLSYYKWLGIIRDEIQIHLYSGYKTNPAYSRFVVPMN